MIKYKSCYLNYTTTYIIAKSFLCLRLFRLQLLTMNKRKILQNLIETKKISAKKYRKILNKYPKKGKELFSKNELLEEYRKLVKDGDLEKSMKLERVLKTKPTRTISGVAPVTVLTKPYECPGNCIFCPTRLDQPKSYLSSEPGAMRAKMLKFDPYKQVQVRIRALKNIGHNTDKIELIILGGTWSHYPKKYQAWFVKECFRGMNRNDRTDQADRLDRLDRLDQELKLEHKRNETAKHRCVGLTIETRPDLITKKSIIWLRKLGATKVQIGVQSLQNKVLKKNNRGHTAEDSLRAVNLLRLAGFKIHAHWMPNLYGSDFETDLADFKLMFERDSIMPDELKIYPCVVLKGTKLYDLYKNGDYKPYSEEALLDLLVKCKQHVTKYCRITRLYRDIPSFEIEAGSKKTNFRQLVQNELEDRGLKCNCIRCREIKDSRSMIYDLRLENLEYKTEVGTEYFLTYETKGDKIAGFLRLLLPLKNLSKKHFIYELQNSAIIREIHVYSPSQKLKVKSQKSLQHRGIGTKLLKRAETIAKLNGYEGISVISAVGTRRYYEKRGYKRGELYMGKKL